MLMQRMVLSKNHNILAISLTADTRERRFKVLFVDIKTDVMLNSINVPLKIAI